MKKLISQKARLLALLKQGKRVTQKDAISLWACYRLASRISELRDSGWNIKVVMVANKNGGRHAQYKLGRPHTFIGKRVEVIKSGEGGYYGKGAEGNLIKVSQGDSDYLVKFDKGDFKKCPDNIWWVKPSHVKFIKGDK